MRYGKRGLSIVGVTDGEKEPTLAWMKKLGADHPWCIDRSSFCLRANVFTYPHAILIEPGGLVIWSGPTAKLPTELIEANLDAAFPRPLHEWPESLAETRLAVRQDRIGGARRSLRAAIAKDEKLASYSTALEAWIARRIAALSTIRKTGDVMYAWDLATRLADDLVDEPEEAAVDAQVESMRTSEEVHAQWEAQNRFWGLAASIPEDRARLAATIEALEALARDNEGRFVEGEARRHVNFLKRIESMGHFGPAPTPDGAPAKGGG